MTTLTNAMLNEGDFLVIRLDLVRALDGDIETAVVLQRIAWRCEREGSWRATQEQIREETGLSEWKVKRSIKRLRSLGWLTSERTSTWDPTPVFRVISVEEESSSTSGRNPTERAGEILPDVMDVSSVTVKEESSVTVEEESSVTSLQKRRDSEREALSTWEYEGAWLSLVWRPRREAMDHALANYPGVDYYAVTVSYIEYSLTAGKGPKNGYWLDRVKQQYERENKTDGFTDAEWADSLWKQEVENAIRYYAARGEPLPDKYKQEGTTTT